MAIEAENLSFDNLKEIVDGLTCRNVSPVVTAELPRGSFDLACFPKDDLDMCENPVVNFFDLIMDYQEVFYFPLNQKPQNCNIQSCLLHDTARLTSKYFGVSKQGLRSEELSTYPALKLVAISKLLQL